MNRIAYSPIVADYTQTGQYRPASISTSGLLLVCDPHDVMTQEAFKAYRENLKLFAQSNNRPVQYVKHLEEPDDVIGYTIIRSDIPSVTQPWFHGSQLYQYSIATPNIRYDLRKPCKQSLSNVTINF